MRSLRIHPLVASTLVKGFLQSFEDLGYMSRKQKYELRRKGLQEILNMMQVNPVRRRSS
ncbi:hypothetical protein Bca4012_099636 [Brassica carinata]